MAKNRTFLKMGPTDKFQTKISGFNIPFGYRNCKNLKRVLQLNWNIDAVYCDVYITCEMWRAMYMNYLVKKVHKDYELVVEKNCTILMNLVVEKGAQYLFI